MKDSKLNYIDRALSLAHSCLNDKRRHPFGSVIVKDGKIVGIGKEATRVNNDPTAHSEIEAIRDACQNLQTSSLDDCVIYTSSEPCAMCLSAISWAHIDTVYYACSREDVYEFGFSDRFELTEKRTDLLAINLKKINLFQIKNEEGIQIFNDWKLRDKMIG